MRNVMIDIETMGTGPNAAICSIGACRFDPEKGEIGETFHEHVTLKDQARKMDADTVLWWLQQGKAAQEALTEGQTESHLLHQVLLWLHDFVHEVEDTVIWAKPPSFDVHILENAFCNDSMLDTPWHWRNVRCVRTLEKSLGHLVEADNFDGVAHNALDDAVNQARRVCALFNAVQIITPGHGTCRTT